MNAALAAAPMLRDCISAVTPCPGQNAFIETNAIAPIDPANLFLRPFRRNSRPRQAIAIKRRQKQEQFRFHATDCCLALTTKWNRYGSAMATITLKNIPADLHRELKKRAEEHHRSLNKEIIATLKSATSGTFASM